MLGNFASASEFPGIGGATVAIETLSTAALLALTAAPGLATGEGAETFSRSLSNINDYAAQRHMRAATEHLGVDTSTVQGLLAAQAFAIGLMFAENGFLTDNPERGDKAKVIAEAIGLYELSRPGLFTLPNSDGLEAVAIAKHLAEQALTALEDGRVIPQDGTLSAGWREVFPELT